MENSEQFDEWYPEAKVYYDGSHYIAIPHTENKARRRKHKQEIITVSEQDGKLKLEKPPPAVKLIECDEDGDIFPVEPEQVTVEEVVKEVEEKPKKAVKRTTRKEVFEELYEKYRSLTRRKRNEAIYNDMLPLFKTETACRNFVEDNAERKYKNLIRRRMRFVRKALNQDFNYFATFTYANDKHTEEIFKRKLLGTFKNFHNRKDWKYMGVWERGKKTNRLHFHGLFYIPEGTLPGEFKETTDYNYKTHSMRTIIQSEYFEKRFGRNEMEQLDRGSLLGSAIAYILKYLEKTGEKITYSRGLYMYFISDIYGDDVVCRLSKDEHDNKIVLSDKFDCWDEGCKVGTVSPSVISKLRKSN